MIDPRKFRPFLVAAVPLMAAASIPDRIAAAWPSAPDAVGDTATASATEFGGGVYLFDHRPIDLEGVDGRSEIYALYGDVSHRDGPWSFHLQARWRDTKLRSFFPSTTWVQEAWGAVTLPLGAGRGEGNARRGEGDAGRGEGDAGRESLTLRAGKIYQRIGRFWDGSFFGNVHYFDGLKLDPEFGAEAVLRLPLAAGGSAIEAYGQAMTDGDRINGSLPGRDLEGAEEGSEGGGLAAGIRWRSPAFEAGPWPLTVSAGASALRERGELAMGADGVRDVRMDHLALDAELASEHGRAYVEWTRRQVEGVSPDDLTGDGSDHPAAADADYWLAGLQAQVGRVQLRYNLSRADYGSTSQVIHQPGLTVDLTDRIHVLLEYDDWTREGGPEGDGRLDRSLNSVLWIQF